MDNIEKMARKLCEIRCLDPDAEISVLEPVAFYRGSTIVYGDDNIHRFPVVKKQWQDMIHEIKAEIDRKSVRDVVNAVVGGDNES